MAERRTRTKILRVPQGDVIIKEGDPADCAYEIITGRVQVETSKGGRKIVLARLGSGQFFGELGLIAEAPRSATVIAAQDCVLRVINRATFNRLLRRSPTSLFPVLKALFDRLREMNARYLKALEYQMLGAGKHSDS